MKKIILSFLLIQLFLMESILAQGGGDDFMRNIGKIYVVVAVILAIFIGIIVFLIYLERKLTKLEDQIQN